MLTLNEFDQSIPEKTKLLEKSKREWFDIIISFEGDMMDDSGLNPAQNWGKQIL